MISPCTWEGTVFPRLGLETLPSDQNPVAAVLCDVLNGPQSGSHFDSNNAICHFKASLGGWLFYLGIRPEEAKIGTGFPKDKVGTFPEIKIIAPNYLGHRPWDKFNFGQTNLPVANANGYVCFLLSPLQTTNYNGVDFPSKFTYCRYFFKKKIQNRPGIWPPSKGGLYS